LNESEERSISDRIKALVNRVGPKVAVPKPAARVSSQTEPEINVEEHRKRQAEVTDQLMVLTEHLRQRVVQTSVASAADAEVLENVRRQIDSGVDGGSKVNSTVNVVKKENLGWKVYYWLFIVILVYIVVNFIFF
jgi:hypothetical protein